MDEESEWEKRLKELKKPYKPGWEADLDEALKEGGGSKLQASDDTPEMRVITDKITALHESARVRGRQTDEEAHQEERLNDKLIALRLKKRGASSPAGEGAKKNDVDDNLRMLSDRYAKELTGIKFSYDDDKALYRATWHGFRWEAMSALGLDNLIFNLAGAIFAAEEKSDSIKRDGTVKKEGSEVEKVAGEFIEKARKLRLDVDEEPEAPFYDPEFERAIEALEDFKEKLEESQKLPPEKRREFWDRELAKAYTKWPTKLLGKCPDLQDQVNETFCYLINFGWGDIGPLCKSTAFREALKSMDLEACEGELQISEVAKKDGIPKAINLCLGFYLERYIKQQLINDGFNEEEVAESGLHDFDPSAISFYWDSDNEKLSEAAQKIFFEEG